MPDFDAVHAAVRTIMLEAADGLDVARDLPGDLEVRVPPAVPGTGQPGWFGTVTIKKSYVAYHLIPLYDAPSVVEGLPPTLAKRRQGKTCFNFKAADQVAFAELADLTQRVRGALP